MAQIAQDTFTVTLKDGSNLMVAKGSAWPDGHEVVLLDAGRGHLFKPVGESFGESPVKAEAAKTPAAASRKGA